MSLFQPATSYTTRFHPAIVRPIAEPRPLLSAEVIQRETLASAGFSQLQAEFAVRRQLPNPIQYRSTQTTLPDYECTLPGADLALDLVREAKRTGTPIGIASDFDADGVCSAAILHTTLTGLGCSVHADTPCRQREGYGANRRIIDELISAGCKTLFFLDFGTTQHQMVRHATSRGASVVVIDHHQLGQFQPPPAHAILNPHVTKHSSTEMCAAGLTFSFCDLLLRHFPHSVNRDALAALAAIATIADVVPLHGLNTPLVRYGLTRVESHPGLALLCQEAGLPRALSSADVAFQLGPLLNAPGRILSFGARHVLKLLLGPAEHQRVAAIELVHANYQRKQREQSDYERALEILAKSPLREGIFVCSDRFDPGVAGLVASRLAERYARPAAVVAYVSPRSGRASVRSAPGFDVHAALTASSKHFERYGGHRAAGGFTMHREQESDAADCFAAQVRQQLGSLQPPVIEADIAAELNHIAKNPSEYVRELSIFEPYGNGNEQPRLFLSNVRLQSVEQVGTEHLRSLVTQAGVSMNGYLWRGAGTELRSLQNRPVDLVVHVSRFLKTNSDRLRHAVALQIVGWRPHQK